MHYRKCGISFLLVSVVQLAAYQPDKVQSLKDLTMLVYIAGDNDLHPYIEADLAEMKNVGSTKNFNILAYVNTCYPGQKKSTKKLMIQPGLAVQYGDDKAYDSGSPETVIKACKWAHTYFPAKKFILVLWNHGSGALNRSSFNMPSPLFAPCYQEIRSVCYDDTYGSVLSDADLQKALKYVCTQFRGGKKVDIVAFDACLMADIEVAYAIAPYADFMVASQETIPGDGYGYDKFLAPLAKTVFSVPAIAQLMVAAYKQEYEYVNQDYTLSALNLARLSPLAANVSVVGKLFTNLLRGANKSTVYTALKAAVANTTHYSAHGHIDLADFYTNCLLSLNSMKIADKVDRWALQTALKDGLRFITPCVIANTCGRDLIKSRGISIYLPDTNLNMGYENLYWGKATSWFEFLKAFNAN